MQICLIALAGQFNVSQVRGPAEIFLFFSFQSISIRHWDKALTACEPHLRAFVRDWELGYGDGRIDLTE